MPASEQTGERGEVKRGWVPLPGEMRICPWGESYALDGTAIVVNEVTLAVLERTQRERGFEEVALDFEHNTVPGEAREEPRAVAGYGRVVVREGEGIFYVPVAWTVPGEKYFTEGHYRDLSPTVVKGAGGVVEWVHSVALTRAGQIAGLHAYGAERFPKTETKFPKTETTETTETKKYMNAEQLREILLKILGLKEDATDEDVAGAFTAFIEKNLEKVGDEVEKVEAGEEVKALSARVDAMERAEVVREATAAGKVIPLSAEAVRVTPLGVLKELCAKLPAGTVPMGGGAVAKVQGGGEVQALSAEEKAVAAMLGLKEEQMRGA